VTRSGGLVSGAAWAGLAQKKLNAMTEKMVIPAISRLTGFGKAWGKRGMQNIVNSV